MADAGHSGRAHARLSPSGSHRWQHSACPGSVQAEAQFPSTWNVYAAKGTAEHELAERCLRSGLNARRHLGEMIRVTEDHAFEVDYEMADAVQVYLDTVRAEFRPGDRLEVETRLAMPFLPGDTFGTADAVLYKPSTAELLTFDYKGGFGIVEPENNTQLACYAVGAAMAFNAPVAAVTCVIVQPHAPHPAGPVRSWALGPAELWEWGAYLKASGEIALAPGAPRRAGSWCRFCRAAHACPELRGKALKEAQAAFAGEVIT